MRSGIVAKYSTPVDPSSRIFRPHAVLACAIVRFQGEAGVMAITVQGKAAIVTGAGRGIGRGIAQVLADDGAEVLVVNRSEAAGKKVVEEITAILSLG